MRNETVQKLVGGLLAQILILGLAWIASSSTIGFYLVMVPVILALTCSMAAIIHTRSDPTPKIHFLIIAVSAIIIGTYRKGWVPLLAALSALVLGILIPDLFTTIPDLFAKWRTVRNRIPLDSEEFESFLMNQLRLLRPMGFFAEHKDLSDEQLAALLKTKILSNDGAWLVRSPVLLLTWETGRVAPWQVDPWPEQADHFYKDCIEKWITAPGADFSLTDIEEIWSGPPRILTLKFTLNGKPQIIRLKVWRKSLDPVFVAAFNNAIQSADRELVLFFEGHDSFSCLYLRPGEKEILRTKGGWKFSDVTERRKWNHEPA